MAFILTMSAVVWGAPDKTGEVHIIRMTTIIKMMQDVRINLNINLFRFNSEILTRAGITIQIDQYSCFKII